jgi:hypothetical protein
MSRLKTKMEQVETVGAFSILHEVLLLNNEKFSINRAV